MVNFCGVKCYDAEVYCDTVNGGGGWLVVQRRQDGSEDFNRTWAEYEDGFGRLTGEFWYAWAESPPLSHWSRWLGNENGHQVS